METAANNNKQSSSTTKKKTRMTTNTNAITTTTTTTTTTTNSTSNKSNKKIVKKKIKEEKKVTVEPKTNTTAATSSSLPNKNETTTSTKTRSTTTIVTPRSLQPQFSLVESTVARKTDRKDTANDDHHKMGKNTKSKYINEKRENKLVAKGDGEEPPDTVTEASKNNNESSSSLDSITEFKNNSSSEEDEVEASPSFIIKPETTILPANNNKPKHSSKDRKKTKSVQVNTTTDQQNITNNDDKSKKSATKKKKKDISKKKPKSKRTSNTSTTSDSVVLHDDSNHHEDGEHTTSTRTEDDDDDNASPLLHDSILVGSSSDLATSIHNNVRPVSDSNIIMNRRLDLLGVSVYWICTGLLAEIKDAGFDPTTSRIHDIETLQPKKTSALRRKGKKIISPMDGRLGSSYVHSLLETSGSGKSNDADCVGHANYLLSYSWNYTFGDIVSTLKEYCTTHSLNPKRTYIWMDCLCINQHRVVESKVNGESGLMNFDQTFPKQLSQIGHLLAMMTVRVSGCLCVGVFPSTCY